MDEEKSQKTLGLIAFVGALAGLISTWYMAQSPGVGFSNTVRVDRFSVFFMYLVIAIAAVVILTSFEYMAVQRIRAGEYYALILFGVVGMVLMSSAIELVMIFIGLEISSISTYILAGFRRNAASSSESSLKYFLLGSFATAFFLYGVALMFGATGSTNIDVICLKLQSGPVQVAGLCGDGDDVCRAGIQSRCGAVSCLDARCLRRRSGADHRLHVDRPQSGGIRRAPTSGIRHQRSRTFLVPLDRGRVFDDPGQRRRAGAGQCQATARLFVDRTCRISLVAFAMTTPDNSSTESPPPCSIPRRMPP